MPEQFNFTFTECKDGLMINYVDGATFPIKGSPTPQQTWAMDIVKKFLIESIKIFPFSLAFKMFSLKSLDKLLESFVRMSDGVMAPYYNYAHFGFPFQVYLHLPCRGVGRIIQRFLINYGINPELSHKVGGLFAHFMEYDSAYRYRLLEIMNEASERELINHPRKEVQRLLKICYNREQMIPTYMRPKLKIISKMAWILEVPKVKKAFSRAIKETTLDFFKLDDIDIYWLLQRKDYYSFGRSPEENMKVLESKGWKTATEYKNHGEVLEFHNNKTKLPYTALQHEKETGEKHFTHEWHTS